MLVLNFDPYPEMSTDRLLLRKPKPGDAADIFEIRSNPDTMKYMARPIMRTLDDAHAHIEKLLKRIHENTGIEWVLEEKASHKLIGTIGIWRIDVNNYRGELGYILNKEWQHKGIMTEVFPMVIRYGFDHIKLHSFEADVDPLNEASARLLEKNRFRREAFFKENHFFDGMYIDSFIYSLVNSSDHH